MDDELLEAMEEKIRDAIESALEEKMGDLADEIADELEGRLEDIIDAAVNDSIIEYFSEGIEEFLSNHQLMLKDGTTLQMRQKTRVMSPDKKKVILCYGGMRVDRKSLQVQTRISCWETLWTFETEEAAVEALRKVSAAIDQGISLIEL